MLHFPIKIGRLRRCQSRAAEKCSEFEVHTNNMEKFIKVRDFASKILHTVQTNLLKLGKDL